MKNNIKYDAIIDLHCPKGHYHLIYFYIKNLKKKNTYLVLNNNFKEFIKKKNTYYTKPFSSGFESFIYSFYIVYVIIKLNIKSVFFLSYDYRFYFITSFLLKYLKIKNFILEHDSIRSRFKNIFFQSLISKNTSRICYTSSIKLFIKRKLNHKKVYLTQHPILKDLQIFSNIYHDAKNMKINKKSVLVPVRFNPDPKIAIEFFKSNRNFKFYCFSKKLILNKNCYYIKNIKISNLLKFDYVFLPIKNSIYDLRVSSWIYKSIAYSKSIIVSPGKTFSQENKKFGSFIFNAKTFKYYNLNKFKKKYNFKTYNQKLISNLKKIIYE